MKEKHNRKTIGNMFSPYAVSDNDTMTDWYEAFKKDPDRDFEFDGKTYTKIISRFEFYYYKKPVLVVSVEPREKLSVGDILIDECGREFTLITFEMFRFATSIPEWYFKVVNMAIQGTDYTIGNYLAKK